MLCPGIEICVRAPTGEGTFDNLTQPYGGISGHGCTTRLISFSVRTETMALCVYSLPVLCPTVVNSNYMYIIYYILVHDMQYDGLFLRICK